jgi:hypothetical protein
MVAESLGFAEQFHVPKVQKVKDPDGKNSFHTNLKSILNIEPERIVSDF